MDNFNYVFHDDGLIQTSLDSKQKKIDVISEFLFSYVMNNEPSEQDEEGRIISELINSLEFKLKTA